LVHLLQDFGNNSSQLRGVIDGGHQMRRDPLGPHLQHATGECQPPEVIVIIPVIVVRFLEGLQRSVEKIAHRDSQRVHQALALRFQAHHVGRNHRVQARHFGLVLGGSFLQLGQRQTPRSNLFAPGLAFRFVLLVRSPQLGYLGRHGWGMGLSLRLPPFQLGQLLLPLRGRMITLLLQQQQTGLFLPQALAFLAQGLALPADDLPIRHLPLELLIGDDPVAGQLVDPVMLVQILKIILLNPTVEDEADHFRCRAKPVIREDGHLNDTPLGISGLYERVRNAGRQD